MSSATRLKQIVGKSFNELELDELISAKDGGIKRKNYKKIF